MVLCVFFSPKPSHAHSRTHDGKFCSTKCKKKEKEKPKVPKKYQNNRVVAKKKNVTKRKKKKRLPQATQCSMHVCA